MDTDLLILALALAAIGYGIYKKSNIAGYNETPPPVTPQPTSVKPTLPSYPGIPLNILDACAQVVDRPGATLVGPLAPKGMDPDRLSTLVGDVVRRMQRQVEPPMEFMVTTIDGGTCVGDADGAEQYELMWMLYERTTNCAVRLVGTLIVLEDGELIISKLVPASLPPANDGVENPFSPGHAPYSFPISPDI